jgi:folate-dependent phosphoribosylglycinamide formyltransferase PurN
MTLRAIMITRENPFFMAEYVGPIFASSAVHLQHVFIDRRPSPHLTLLEIVYLASPLGLLRLLGLRMLACLPGGLALAGFKGERRVAAMAARQRIPVSRMDSAQFDGVTAMVRRIAPDVIISVGNSHILPAEIVAAAKVAALNSHGSLLPRYRGILAGFWAMLNAETKSGVTIHRMAKAVDSGPIVGQRVFDISSDETLFSYYGKVARVGGSLWSEVLTNLAAGRLDERPMPPDQRSYAQPSFSDLRRFRALGRRFL